MQYVPRLMNLPALGGEYGFCRIAGMQIFGLCTVGAVYIVNIWTEYVKPISTM